MSFSLDSLVVLAAELPGQGGGGPPAAAGDGPNPLISLAPFILILVAFLWFTSRSQKKRQAQREEFLESLRVKDDVMTVGGIYGRIVEVKDKEFVLRIDPSKDIQITIAKTGVHRRAGDEDDQQ